MSNDRGRVGFCLGTMSAIIVSLFSSSEALADPTQDCSDPKRKGDLEIRITIDIPLEIGAASLVEMLIADLGWRPGSSSPDTASSAAPSTLATSCSPPYWIDERRHKHVKPQCL